MREPYGKAVATRAGPEPWWGVCEDALQASAGVRAGWVWSRESHSGPRRRGCSLRPKATSAVPLLRGTVGPRAVEDPMHVRKLSVQELGGPASGRGGDGAAVRAVNPMGARRR